VANRHLERDLQILTAIGEGAPLTQRVLAKRLGVALGLANLYLKRLGHKGLIKIGEFPAKPATRKRLRYLLTPKGFATKTRLTFEYVSRSVELYRLARQTLRGALADLPRDGKGVALYGDGEAAELAYLTLKELGLEPVGVFAHEARGAFLGMPVRATSELATLPVDRIVVATFDKPKLHVPGLLALGIPADKLVTLDRPSRRVNGQRAGRGGAR
jgi:DNA-binding MarR family transcriptional regulator